eukprot:5455252-Prymnesium_polylepis.2
MVMLRASAQAAALTRREVRHNSRPRLLRTVETVHKDRGRPVRSAHGARELHRTRSGLLRERTGGRAAERSRADQPTQQDRHQQT